MGGDVIWKGNGLEIEFGGGGLGRDVYCRLGSEIEGIGLRSDMTGLELGLDVEGLELGLEVEGRLRKEVDLLGLGWDLVDLGFG